MPKTVKEASERALFLRQERTRNRGDMAKVRAVMDGGADAVAQLLGDVQGLDDHMPAANLMLSGLTRLGQKLGRLPDLRVDPPADKDSERARKNSEKLERIVTAYDEAAWMDQLLPQVGRWLPGYAYVPFVLVERTSPDGFRYPHVELRDPYDSYPAPWNANNQPQDMAVFRRVQLSVLETQYPGISAKIERQRPRARTGGGVILDRGPGASGGVSAQSDWENPAQHGVEVVEYYDSDAFWLLLPAYEIKLERVDNVLTSGPQFVVAKRHAFNKLVGQYDHVMGLMAMQAKLNLLAQVVMEDEAFAEALALDTPLPTPDGWTTMGEVQEGDQLIGSDGLPVDVTKTTEVQQNRSCYRVTFEDGTSVIASDGHLWETYISGTRQVPRVRTTWEMLEDGRTFRVPKASPWKFPEADLPIEPYMLGLWLGDGSSRSSIITVSQDDVSEIEQIVQDLGYTTKRHAVGDDRAPGVYVSEPGSIRGRHGPGGLHRKLRVNGLLRNKHVPSEYLRSSIDQRVALLQGLMDSDGTANRYGNCCFSNTNERLATAVMELLRSLGEVPVLRWADDSKSRSGGCWLVTFTPRNIMPFRLGRKAERVTMHGTGPDWVSIRSIEPVDSVPVRCVAVSSNDRLFLAGPGAHLTHNTVVEGELDHQWQKGRFAINQVPQGSKVYTMQRNFPFQGFEQINRVERQLRQTAGYPVTDDAQSPNSYVTGQGLEELQGAVNNEVSEYQGVLARALQLLDAKRLEWDEKAYPNERKPLIGTLKGEPFEDRYTPARDIKGRHRTRRVYGMMAAWDDSSKIVGGLQLMSAEAISTQTFQENLDGLDNVTRENERINDEKAQQAIMQMILTHASDSQSPEHRRALEAAVNMLPEGDFKDIGQRWLDESKEEDEAITEELATQQAQAPPGPAPDVPTVLSRLTQGGQTRGGVQTQGPVRR